MTLEEKVGQLLIVHFNGKAFNEEALELIHKAHVGGFIYYNWANGLESPAQVEALSRSLQAHAKYPLFIAIDQEGGNVTRLSQGFTTFPGNKQIGETNNPALAEEAARTMAKEMLAVGINVNFAPVVDIHALPNNRSFGDTSEKVIEFAKRALHGYRQEHMICCLKHFPGMGKVTLDPHEDLPILNKLEESELLPFKELGDEADMIMTGHVLIPSLDEENCVTLSSKILKEFLSDYKGIIISDSLNMEGVLKKTGSPTLAALLAFEAGSDILLLGGKILNGSKTGFELTSKDIIAIHKALVDAVQTGRITEERLNHSLNKILTLKKSHGLIL